MIEVQKLPRDPIDIFDCHALDGIDIVLGRVASFNGDGTGPFHGEAGNGVALEFGAGDLAAFGGFDEIGRHAVFRGISEDLLHLLEQVVRICPSRKAGDGITEAGFWHGVIRKGAKQRLAFRHEAVKVAAPAAQDIGEDLGGGVIPAVETWKAEGDGNHTVGQVGFELDGVGSDGLENIRGTRRKSSAGDSSENGFDFIEGFLQRHVAGDHENSVVWRVPGGLEFPQVGVGGFIERRPCAERVVFIWRASEHDLQELHVKNVFRVGKVLGDFLLDGAALFGPELLASDEAGHAVDFNVQGQFQILSGRGEKILGDGLLGVRVEIAAEHGGDIRELIAGKSGAAAKHHVFGGMGGAGKAWRRFVGTDLVIDDGCDHGGERIMNDDDAHAVGEGFAEDFGAWRDGGRSAVNAAADQKRDSDQANP